LSAPAAGIETSVIESDFDVARDSHIDDGLLEHLVSVDA
jgi:hypothetical protein